MAGAEQNVFSEGSKFSDTEMPVEFSLVVVCYFGWKMHSQSPPQIWQK